MKRILLTIALATSALPALADMSTANGMIDQCAITDKATLVFSLTAVQCISFAKGFVEGVQTMDIIAPGHVCLPREGIMIDSLLMMVEEMIDLQPKLGATTPRVALFFTLKAMYPCK